MGGVVHSGSPVCYPSSCRWRSRRPEGQEVTYLFPPSRLGESCPYSSCRSYETNGRHETTLLKRLHFKRAGALGQVSHWTTQTLKWEETADGWRHEVIKALGSFHKYNKYSLCNVLMEKHPTPSSSHCGVKTWWRMSGLLVWSTKEKNMFYWTLIMTYCCW